MIASLFAGAPAGVCAAYTNLFSGYIAKGVVAAGDVTAVAMHLTLTIDVNAKAVVAGHYQDRPSIDKKSTGSPVSVDPFIDGSMPRISAVLGSREDAANRPRRLGDGLALFPNLSAANAWPAGSIPLGQEWVPTHLTVGDVDLEKHSYIEA
jgi:hypothetical protein